MADLDIKLVDSSYELVCKLASSGQADVYQARVRAEAPEDQDFDFIFKVYKDSPKANQAMQAMKNERLVLQKLEDCQVKGVPIPIGLQDYCDNTGEPPPEIKCPGLLAKFLKGKNLADLLEDKAAKTGFDPGQVADWVKKLCEILGKVHKQGIVHGDIKPGNVLWNKEHNVIWLIDFGSAVFAGSAAQRSFTLTRPYASPQLLAGETSRVTDDVYALGVTIFELLAGKHEYPVSLDWNLESNVLAVQLKTGLQKLDVAAAFKNRGLFKDGDDDLRPRFAAVVQKCLHPDPKERFQTLDKVLNALKLPNVTVTAWITHEEPVVLPPPTPWWGRHRVALAWGVATVVMAVATAGIWSKVYLKPFHTTPVTVETLLPGQKTNKQSGSTPISITPVARASIATPEQTNNSRGNSTATKSNPALPVAVAQQPQTPEAPTNHPPPAHFPEKEVQSEPVVAPAPTLAKVPAPRPPFNRAASRFTNSLGMVFVPVQTPSGKVWFCIWQTRVSDFQQFQQATKADFNASLKQRLNDQKDLPVRSVTWEQAQAFCSWLTKTDVTAGLLPLAGTHYRLPRDLEWSAAAGLGPETGQTPKERMNGLELKLDTFILDRQFHPVSASDGGANARGLYYLEGNVAEWCEDVYDTDEQMKTFRTSKVIGDDDRKARYRGARKLFNAEEWLGFRCVLEPGSASDPIVADGVSSP